jgi:hypothetical protein
MVAAVVLLWTTLASSPQPWTDLLRVGAQSSSASIIADDFDADPELLPETLGHDGQHFYMFARSPLDRDLLAATIDRPTYRLQRPLLPALTWPLPLAPGPQLGAALLIATLAGALGASLGVAALAAHFRAPMWIAGLVPVIPGVWFSIRLVVADGLALALVAAALAASLRGRPRLAVLAAIAAVLAKEVTVLAFVGLWLWRRDRPRAALALVPAAVAGTWFVMLRLWLPASESDIKEFAVPFSGMINALPVWIGERQFGAAFTVIGSMVLVAIVVSRRRQHPLTYVAAAHLPLLASLDAVVLEQMVNAARATLPIVVFGAVALATPPDRRRLDEDSMTRRPRPMG